MKKYAIFLMACLAFSGLKAQTLAQGQELYGQGKYEEAKPIFQKYVKSQPSNGKYNLWYGVCCLHTNEPKTALKHLKTAVKRRTPGGQLYLAQAYEANYQYDKAVETFEDYIADLNKRKRNTDEAEKHLARAKAGYRMLKGIEEVCIIDSVIVPKDKFLTAYKISEESGKLYTFDDLLRNGSHHEGTVFENELGNKLYYGMEDENGLLNIYQKNKSMDSWSKGIKLPDNINASGNTNYPYVMSDGTTIYYASDGEGSIGGYDIFVTRYNTYTDSYLAPENIGMPFNSPYNDYMFVIDEFNEIGWFASDRFQTDDNVCIYIFVPNRTKRSYDYESMEPEKAERLAKIHSIRESWTDEESAEKALARLTEVRNQRPEARVHHDFVYVIDDQHTYYSENNFKSPKAKNLFKSLQQKQKDLTELQDKLEKAREKYSTLSASKQDEMAPAILDQEKRIQEMLSEIEQLDFDVRNTEIAHSRKK